MESSIAEFLMRWLACELPPTTTAGESSKVMLGTGGRHWAHKRLLRHFSQLFTASMHALSTVLVQDHFYSDYTLQDNILNSHLHP